MLDVEFVQLSDVGLVREQNEDCVGYVAPEAPNRVGEEGCLFVLADGVGGQDRGEVASRLTVDVVVSGFRNAVPGEAMAALLPKLVQRANERVYETAMNTGPGGSSMATTVVACGFRYDRVLIAHVGDSRCYLIRKGRASALTRDHTIPNEQLRMGLITTREAAQAQTTHVLSRSIGSSMIVNVDTAEHQIYPEDVFLLCSDGLHNSVGADDMAKRIRPGSDLKEAAEDLVSMAKHRDGQDNISVQLVRIRNVERVGMYRGRPYQLR